MLMLGVGQLVREARAPSAAVKHLPLALIARRQLLLLRRAS